MAIRTLGLMAKYWRPGRVKTRLGASIGFTTAAQLHRLFCHHLIESLADCCDRRQIVVWPPEDAALLRDWLDSAIVSPPGEANWDIEVQSPGDLGDRMKHWFESSSSSTRSETCRILIGADCPLIDSDLIGEAIGLLGTNAPKAHDVVLGPARDGGYYLIGLQTWNGRFKSLFEDIPWSSESVLEATLDRANRAGLTVAMLDTLSDVDTEADLDDLRGAIDAGAGSPQAHQRLKRLNEQIESILSAEKRG
ncbi:TIGR04282 family arsenosugar biosynthesis glycosyltransferase [Roseiconus lacunae]|uniref:TIGR04282 family arsenosugar biosynthesis glycosyltransferase n=1 Tax=Roseiconus lacunae TaxID=2605694 RepID=UPI0011F3C837|nr:TIGR04282 family arsenosugar biosynthesis glycosyltransferase [Roseiconus lacunae]